MTYTESLTPLSHSSQSLYKGKAIIKLIGSVYFLNVSAQCYNYALGFCANWEAGKLSLLIYLRRFRGYRQESLGSLIHGMFWLIDRSRLLNVSIHVMALILVWWHCGPALCSLSPVLYLNLVGMYSIVLRLHVCRCCSFNKPLVT